MNIEYWVALYRYSIATQNNAMPIFSLTHSNSVVYGTQICNRNKYVCLFKQLLGKSHPEKSLLCVIIKMCAVCGVFQTFLHILK